MNKYSIDKTIASLKQIKQRLCAQEASVDTVCDCEFMDGVYRPEWHAGCPEIAWAINYLEELRALKEAQPK